MKTTPESTPPWRLSGLLAPAKAPAWTPPSPPWSGEADALSAARTALQGDISRLETEKLRFEVLVEKSVSAGGDSTLNLPVGGSLLSRCVVAAVDIRTPGSRNCYLGINGSIGSPNSR